MRNNHEETNKDQPEENEKKLTYEKPTLLEFGKVEQLTFGSATNGNIESGGVISYDYT